MSQKTELKRYEGDGGSSAEQRHSITHAVRYILPVLMFLLSGMGCGGSTDAHPTKDKTGAATREALDDADFDLPKVAPDSQITKVNLVAKDPDNLPPVSPVCTLFTADYSSLSEWAELLPLEKGGWYLLVKEDADFSKVDESGIVYEVHDGCKGKKAIHVPGMDCDDDGALSSLFLHTEHMGCVRSSLIEEFPILCANGELGPYACARTLKRLKKHCTNVKKAADKTRCETLQQDIRRVVWGQ